MFILFRAIITISFSLSISIAFCQSDLSASDSIAKDTINTNPYYALDEYAKATPEKSSRSLKELAAYLEKKATNDLEKARLIYSWIATHIQYDDKAYNSGRYPEQSADRVLKKRSAVCAGYSMLFEELANLMDLTVAKISGYAKGYGYINGQRISKVNHDWNAVKLKGKWQLIDATWGSSESERTTKGLKSTMKFDDYWFLLEPEKFIFSHMPVDKKWQLIKSKITLKEYNNLPYVSQSFFEIGFDPNEILESTSNKSLKLVEAYRSKYSFKVIDAPYSSPLIKGKEYTFKFESMEIKRIAFIEDGEWTYINKENNVLSTVFVPRSKILKIAVSKFSKAPIWDTILKYNVTEKK